MSNKIQSFDMTDNKTQSTNVVRSIVSTPGKLWVGTINNGLFCFGLTDLNELIEQKNIELGMNSIKDLYVDTEKNVWVCGKKLLKISTQKDEKIEDITKQCFGLDENGEALSITMDTYGHLWIAFQNALVSISITGTPHIIGSYKHSTESQAHLYFDNERSELWLCSRHKGLRCYKISSLGEVDECKIYQFNSKSRNSLSSNHVWYVQK